MTRVMPLEGDNTVGRDTVYFISVGVIGTLAAFQIIEHAFAGIYILWRILAIIAVLTMIVHNLYNHLLDQANGIANTMKENWRQIFEWMWRKIKENWRPLVQLCWNFAKENLAPFFRRVTQYLREKFKPALQRLWRFLAMKSRALTDYVNQLISRASQYLQRLELRRKLVNALTKAVAKVKEIGKAVIRVLRVQIPIAIRNLLHDFNEGFFPIVEALLSDFMRAGRHLLIQFGRINHQVIQGVWNDVKEKFKRAKDSIKASFANLGTKIKAAIKRNVKKLGQKAIAAVKNRILRPLWEWVKSDWRRLTRLIWDNLSPRWQIWLANTFGFFRDELNEHPLLRDWLEEMWNDVEIRVFYAVWAMVLLVMSIFFYIPTGEIRAISKGFGTECHQLKPQRDIHTVLTVIPDYQWEAICANLGVSAKVLLELKLQYAEYSVKMEICLDAFATQESACWETVMIAVCDSPFHDQELAKRIAKTYNISWAPLEDICGAKLK